MLKRIAGSLLALFVSATLCCAATLLPNGEQTFLSNNGLPLAGGQVYFYIPNTLTPKATYQNSGETISNTNPVTLDSSGRAIIYGAGQYRQQVYDSTGNLIYDQLTADTSATSYSWAATSGGTANAQTVTAPNFTTTDGQQIGFIAGLSNTGAFTLTPNSGSPINVVKGTGAGPISLSAGDIIAGNQYEVTYSATNGNFQLNSTPPTPPISTQQPIASATTTDIGTIISRNVLITGSVTITSLGYSASVGNQTYFITFSGSPILTQSSALMTPNGESIQAVPGATALAIYLGSAVWQIVTYTPPYVPVQVLGRLTLTSGVPVLTSPVSGASTIYWTPYNGGGQVPVWNGGSFVPVQAAQLSEALSDTTYAPAAAVANSIYDEFICEISGSLVLSRGPAWSSSSSRSLSLSLVAGVWVNASSYTNGCAAGYGVYMGTVATDSGAATVSWSNGGAASGGVAGVLNVWNEYDRVVVAARSLDSGGSYNYASGTIREARASAGNQVSFVIGISEDAVNASVAAVNASSVAGSVSSTGIGLDSTATFSAAPFGVQSPGSGLGIIGGGSSTLASIMGIGNHTISRNEATAFTAATGTFDESSNDTLSVSLRM